MRTDAYIDTSIYVYVALRNRAYFEKCRLILRDALSGRFTAYGSPMVAVELLGSLSRVDPVLAREALRACLAMPLRSLELTQAAPGSSAPFTNPRAPLAGSWVAPFRGGPPWLGGLLPASPRAHPLLAPRAAPTHGPVTGVGTR